MNNDEMVSEIMKVKLGERVIMSAEVERMRHCAVWVSVKMI
jgi:hypothetical protein